MRLFYRTFLAAALLLTLPLSLTEGRQACRLHSSRRGDG
jgi:hypothetical protein